MKRLSLNAVGLGCILLSASCAPVEEGEHKPGEIPTIQLLCDSSASVCSPGVAYVGLSARMVDCENYFNSFGPKEPLEDRFDAVGRAPAVNKGIHVEALISVFWNRSEKLVRDLPSKDHRVCAFVDMNNNKHWEYPEPRAEGIVLPGGPQVKIIDWF